ncbi:MAG: hypothetical protein SWK76_12565 [Actinomycetota bacterium]|nr:hypothetical protein [Actinomycetota bacterium]
MENVATRIIALDDGCEEYLRAALLKAIYNPDGILLPEEIIHEDSLARRRVPSSMG